jgi:signal transduction histidine kinase
LHGQPSRTYIQFLGSPASTDQPGRVTLAGLTLPARGQETCWSDNGTSFLIEYESAPLRNNGQLVGAVLTFRDIGRREAAQRAKDEVIAVVSHELRSPLTSIRAALGLLASRQVGQLTDQAHRLVEIGVANADRLLRLLNDLLDLERINAGQVRLRGAV